MHSFLYKEVYRRSVCYRHETDDDILFKDNQPKRMPDIYEQIEKQIRDLRTTLRGQGISQEDLAQAVDTTANSVSRWETATYKPSISDLEKLAHFFGSRLPSSSHSRNPNHGPMLF